MSEFNDKLDFVDKDIYFLEPSDLDLSSYTLKPQVTRGNPTMIMVYSNNCYYCTIAKPEFIKLSSMSSDITLLAISLDEKDKTPIDFILHLYPDFQGVPTFFLFDKFGKFNNIYKGKRQADDMLKALI